MDVEVTINGRKRFVRDSLTVFQAAAEAGVYIPHFCYHPKLSIAANCRMCLVEINNLPKPMPACATHVTDGMVIETGSAKAQAAQQGVMECLLINHPLDCPICDQGGECQLQDLAVGYGQSCTHYGETKRVVVEKQLGPLITTAMTRCIHCTRCVRFGQEIAGTMELGMAGRGEHAEIMAFVGSTVDSELSGNMIDVCPVGALNSKPFQFSARTWELARKPGVSSHDAWGSYLVVQTKDEQVKRVLPRAHEEINECWLSDRDRFAYAGLDAGDRLTVPRVVEDGARIARRTDWNLALSTATQRIRKVIDRHGPDQVGFLVGPQASTEEALLLALLARGLGCANIDSRLRQVDFSSDTQELGIPWLGCTIHEIESLPSILLVGCNPANELPLLPLRLRAAMMHNGAVLASVGCIGLPQSLEPNAQQLVPPSGIAPMLAAVADTIAAGRGMQHQLPPWLAGLVGEGADGQAKSIADCLAAGGGIMVGAQALLGSDSGLIRQLCQLLAGLSGGFAGVLPTTGNAVGFSLAGAVPHRGPLDVGIAKPGLDARSMIGQRLKAYVLLNCEPLDFADPQAAEQAFAQAELTIALDCFESVSSSYATVQLPIAASYERSGSTVNLEGNASHVPAAASPPGEAREAWKVLRVIGKDLTGEEAFRMETLGEVHRILSAGGDFSSQLSNPLSSGSLEQASVPGGESLERIPEVSHFAVDSVLRRAEPLQATEIAARSPPAALKPADLERLALASRGEIELNAEQAAAKCKVRAEDSLAAGCIRAPQGESAFAAVGGAASLTVASAPAQRKAA